jgi:hypothetical protein
MKIIVHHNLKTRRWQNGSLPWAELRMNILILIRRLNLLAAAYKCGWLTKSFSPGSQSGRAVRKQWHLPGHTNEATTVLRFYIQPKAARCRRSEPESRSTLERSPEVDYAQMALRV